MKSWLSAMPLEPSLPTPWLLRWSLLTGVLFLVFVNFYTLVFTPGPKLLFENSDFEKGNLIHWVPSGDAFRGQPICGDASAIRGRGKSSLQGQYWIGTYEDASSEFPGAAQGDAPTGRLESIPFTITGDAITFLLGGGNDTDETGVELRVKGKRVRFERGKGIYRDQETMERIIWDVSQWKGSLAQIVILDESSLPWGHINVDDFRYY